MAYHPFRHLGLKIVALALATLLWFSVAGEQTVERIMRVPLEFRNIPTQLEVVGDPPGTVDIRVRGSSALLSRMEPGEVVAVLDLANARPGLRMFHIKGEDVRTPYGVEVSQVITGTIAIEFEVAGRRTVPVEPDIEGDVAPGFVVGLVTAEPSTVEIVGPESRLKKIDKATTEPVRVEGARTTVRDVVAVGLADSTVRLREPQQVTVIVEVKPSPIERALERVPVRARNLRDGLTPRVSPQTVTVRVRGDREALAALAGADVEAFVDLDGLGPGRYNLRVQFAPSERFIVTGASPQDVTVIIR